MKNKLMLSLAVVLLGLSYGCRKDLNSLPNEIDKVENQVESKKYNPYSVENMRIAVSNLMMKDVQLLANKKQKYVHGTMTTTTSAEALVINEDLTREESLTLAKNNIVASHYYLKFMPANEKDYAKLKMDSNLVIYPFPLDAAVSKYSGNYRDPSLPKDVPTYQYASVSVNYKLPDVPYTKLADLYLPDERSKGKLVVIKGAGGSSYSISGWALANESECDGGEEEPPVEARAVAPPEEDCEDEYGGGGPSTGTGSLEWEWRPSGRITMNDDTHGIIGVGGLKVRARRWFKTYTAITDADGYYHVDGTFTRQANYWLNFERYDFSVNDHHGGPAEIGDEKRKGPWNLELTGFNKFCATIFRAAFHYYYGDIQGLSRPPENSFWATQVKIAAFYSTGSNDAGPTRGLILGEFIHIYDSNYSSKQIYATTIHELGHLVHWLYANNFQRPWLSSYDFYQDFFCESWARGAEWALTSMEYPGYEGGLVIMPDGYTNVVIDLIDENYDTSNRGYNDSKDLVSGYTIKQIQDALLGASNATEWKNNLKNNYANSTEQNLDALFSAWGF